MIQKLLPLTENKLKILKFIYEKKETHLLDIAKNLNIHPYSLQKTIKTLKPLLEERKAGRTILLKIDRNITGYMDLILLIEDYKLKTENKTLRILITKIQEQFNNNILCCVLFGSYARNTFNEQSDIDLLFIAKKKDEINQKISQLSILLNKEINPLILTEKEFKKAAMLKEPTIITILEPSQRIIIIGKEWFLKHKYIQ